MKQWFESLTQREQVSLLVVALALALYLVFFALISPLDRARDEMASQNRGVAESLHRVDELVSQILALRQPGPRDSTMRNLAGLLNRSTSEHALQVARLQPNSRGELQVRLEDVAFDNFAAWLYQLEYHEGVVILEASVTQAGSVGQVNATVRLAEGG